MSSNCAVVVDPDHTLVIAPVDEPLPLPNEAIVQVSTTSLNRGEVRRSTTRAPAGWRPGWDIAGTVIVPAADGTGVPAGTRVVGVLPGSGGWARRIAVPASTLATIPDRVSFAQAASLPVAGLTALYGLGKGGGLLGRNVLITGATGGVGHFACQLAQASGARVVAAVRTEHQIPQARIYGAPFVVATGEDPRAILAEGPYDVILESVGAASLQAALSALSSGGVCVSIGVSSGAEVSFNAEAFFYSTGSLTGLVLFKELQSGEGAAAGLTRLLRLVGDGRVIPHIADELAWTGIDAAARGLLQRKSPGKIVLHLDGAE